MKKYQRKKKTSKHVYKNEHEKWYYEHQEEIDARYQKGTWIACDASRGVVWSGELLDGYSKEELGCCYFTKVGFGRVFSREDVGCIFTVFSNFKNMPKSRPLVKICWKFLINTKMEYTKTYTKLSLVDTGADSSRVPLEHVDDEDMQKIAAGDFADIERDEDENPLSFVTMAKISVEGSTQEFTTIVTIVKTEILGMFQSQPMWIAGRQGFQSKMPITFVGSDCDSYANHKPGTIIWHNLYSSWEAEWNQMCEDYYGYS